MNRKQSIVLAAIAVCVLPSNIRAQEFIHTSGGPYAWNDNNNWGPSPPQPFPNDPGDAAIILGPVGTNANLSIELGQPITIGSLEIRKPTGSDSGSTTITGSATNTLTFSSGTSSLINRISSAGTGTTTIAAPVIFDSTFAVTQESNELLQFTGSLSGLGGLTVARAGTGSGGRVVVLGAANTYQGAQTTFTGSAADDFLVVRLANATAIPATTNLSLGNSAVLELAAADLNRSLGTGAGQIQFGGTARNGFAAFGVDRAVNLGGNVVPDQVVWGNLAGQANFSQLVLGVSTSTAMVDFQNPLELNNGTGNRNIRSYDGPAAIEGRISGKITGPSSITKIGDGVLSFAADNDYVGFTQIEGGTLRLDHSDALPGGNLRIGSGGSLGIGADTTPGDPNSDFARDLGTGAGQIQLISIGTGGNQANAGFSAHGGNRSVVLNSGAMLTWNSGSFLTGGTGTVNRYLLLGVDTSDGTLDFKNPVDLNGANRTIVARNGSAVIDGKLSGQISGSGAASGLIKDNPGTLELSAANTYEGITQINEGVLLLTNATSIPGGVNGGNLNNITINSPNINNVGAVGLGHGDFTTPLGTGAGQFQIVGSGGFAAYGANRAVNLGGAGAQVIWGSGGFVANLSRLALGAVGADATVDFQNAIDLGNAAREYRILNGSANVDGVLSGVLSGAGGSLVKLSGGTLAVTASNTYDGGTTVSEGRLLVNNSSGSGVGSGDVSVTGGSLGGNGFIGTPGDASNVTLSGTARLAPGESAGELTVHGNVGFTATNFLDIELASDTSFDELTIDGAATLNGTLNVTLLDGYVPAPNSSFEILTATGGLGGTTFANVILPTITGAAWAEPTYTANSVVLSTIATTTPGDHNADGVVDAADYVAWRKNPAAFGGDPNGYDDWREDFGSGGPGSGASSSGAGGVPEPATNILLLVLAAALLSRSRKRWYQMEHCDGQ